MQFYPYDRAFKYASEVDEPTDMSLAIGIVDNVLMHAITSKVQVIDLEFGKETALILYDGKQTGHLPAEQAEAAIRRIELLAGMYRGVPAGKAGRLDAHWNEEPHTWTVERFPERIRLTYVP